mgnify:CR=1 FL=1
MMSVANCNHAHCAHRYKDWARHLDNHLWAHQRDREGTVLVKGGGVRHLLIMWIRNLVLIILYSKAILPNNDNSLIVGDV